MDRGQNAIICTIVALTLLGLILIVLRIENTQNVDVVKGEGITIGFSMDSLVIERWQRDKEIFIAKAKEMGADVIVLNANEDNDRQIQQIRFLMDQDVDVLVIVAYDKEGLSQVVRSAKKKGIRVIAYDRLIKNAGVDAYISFDNYKVGTYMAEYIQKKVPIGNYIIINGSTYDNNAFMINEGVYSVLDRSILGRKVNIVDEVWADGWREEIAYSSVEKALGEGKKIDAIIAGNDRLAEAAIQALSEGRLAGEVEVVGQDADLSACQRIVEDTQLMTVYKPIRVLAQSAAELAIAMAKGEKIDLPDSINDGSQEVPFYICKPIPVTKHNIMDTVIKDGFHSLDEVYRNVPKEEWPKEYPP